jgi:hypothetical protein
VAWCQNRRFILYDLRNLLTEVGMRNSPSISADSFALICSVIYQLPFN